MPKTKAKPSLPLYGAPAPLKRATGPKPPVDRLSQRVCVECERNILVGYSGGIQVRLEPDLVTSAAEPVLWSLGQPTYGVLRDGPKVTLDLRVPSMLPPADEVAVAHICQGSLRWMSHVQECPQWFGFSRYVVAYLPDRGYLVLQADEAKRVYKEILLCFTQEGATETVHLLNWRYRAAEIR